MIYSSICDPDGRSLCVNPHKKRVVTVVNPHDCESFAQVLKGGKENIVTGVSASNNEFVSRASTSCGHFIEGKGYNKAENNIDSAARGD